MYAIVKTGGKQYRVEQGQTLLVERLPEPEGATVSLEPLLYRSDEAVFDAAGLAKVEVQATIVGHLRGKKLRVFKFKPKRGYQPPHRPPPGADADRGHEDRHARRRARPRQVEPRSRRAARARAGCQERRAPAAAKAERNPPSEASEGGIDGA